MSGGLSVLTLALVFVAVRCGANATSLRSNTCEDCEENKKKPSPPDWDFLLFVNQWPESFCLYYNASRHSNVKCLIPPRIHDWTIHGLWPTKRGTEGPVSCNNTWPFDLSKIKDLVPEMNNTWPDYLTQRNYWTFWEHEWDKHGTCAASLPVLKGEHNFFATTIKQKQHFNIDGMLNNSGIVPSSSAKYDYDKILQAIKKGTGGLPDIICYQKHENSGFQQYLAEIRMCLDKSFKPFDCPKSEYQHLSSADYSPCSSKTVISLPPIKN